MRSVHAQGTGKRYRTLLQEKIDPNLFSAREHPEQKLFLITARRASNSPKLEKPGGLYRGHGLKLLKIPPDSWDWTSPGPTRPLPDPTSPRDEEGLCPTDGALRPCSLLPAEGDKKSSSTNTIPREHFGVEGASLPVWAKQRNTWNKFGWERPLKSSSPSFDESPWEEKRGKWDPRRLNSSRTWSCNIPLCILEGAARREGDYNTPFHYNSSSGHRRNSFCNNPCSLQQEVDMLWIPALSYLSGWHDHPS